MCFNVSNILTMQDAMEESHQVRCALWNVNLPPTALVLIYLLHIFSCHDDIEI